MEVTASREKITAIGEEVNEKMDTIREEVNEKMDTINDKMEAILQALAAAQK